MDNSLKHFFGSLRDHIGNIVNPTGASRTGGTQTQTNEINIYTDDPATAGQSVADETNGLAAWFDGSTTPAY